MVRPLEPWLDAIRVAIDAAIATRFSDAWPARFGEALAYPLQPGGKRIRPALCVSAHDAVGGQRPDAARHMALAVELVHTYSLVHDDLPAMDDDDIRRGRPATHIAYDDGVAILVGDALLTEAFTVLSETDIPADAVVKAVKHLSHAAGYAGMVGGQAADVGIEGPVRDVSTLTRLHRMKTGALLQVSAVLGGLAGNASDAELESLSRYGAAVGLAFQLADDLLDADEDAHNEQTPSFPRLLGHEATNQRANEALQDALGAAEELPHPERLAALARFAVQRTW